MYAGRVYFFRVLPVEQSTMHKIGATISKDYVQPDDAVAHCLQPYHLHILTLGEQFSRLGFRSVACQPQQGPGVLSCSCWLLFSVSEAPGTRDTSAPSLARSVGCSGGKSA